MQTCSKLKINLLSFLEKSVKVTEWRDSCVVTLPIETVDKRRVSVIVESVGDTFIVHDGGKTLSELFCHGISLTGGRMEYQIEIAHSHGVHLQNKMLRKICKLPGLESAIFAVALCSSMSMLDLVTHRPKFDEDSIPLKVAQILNTWKPSDVLLKIDVDVKTADSDHRLTAVCYGPLATVAVKVLGSEHPKANAQRYGFLGYEFSQSGEYMNWKRLAVVSGVNRWSKPSISLVRRHSDRVIEVPDRNENDSLVGIPAIMDDLIRQPSAALIM